MTSDPASEVIRGRNYKNHYFTHFDGRTSINSINERLFEAIEAMETAPLRPSRQLRPRRLLRPWMPLRLLSEVVKATEVIEAIEVVKRTVTEAVWAMEARW